jgi:hypothetical protein
VRDVFRVFQAAVERSAESFLLYYSPGTKCRSTAIILPHEKVYPILSSIVIGARLYLLTPRLNDDVLPKMVVYGPGGLDSFISMITSTKACEILTSRAFT